jgi:hypothetical protein
MIYVVKNAGIDLLILDFESATFILQNRQMLIDT